MQKEAVMISKLDEIQARADAASTGPWAIDLDDYDGASVYMDDGDTWGRAYVCTDLQQGEYEGKNDAEFIAHAREDVPRLVAALRAVEAVAPPTGDDYTFDLGYAAALDKVRNTIREALT